MSRHTDETPRVLGFDVEKANDGLWVGEVALLDSDGDPRPARVCRERSGAPGMWNSFGLPFTVPTKDQELAFSGDRDEWVGVCQCDNGHDVFRKIGERGLRRHSCSKPP